jgi:methylase of polypeptide subunit release factors
MLLRPEESNKFFSQTEVFFCPEESQFYSHCLDLLVLTNCVSSDVVAEFGSGDGSPVISALLRTQFKGLIHGYDLNSAACKVANTRIEQYKLSSKYVVHNQSFFEPSHSKADYLIANPPYLPAPDDNILMPLLHGGSDGAVITKKLLTLDYQNVLLMISSYSNPVDTINHAIDQGYYVADFMVSPLKFGYYSSEPKVEQTILELRKHRKAFYSKNIYFLAGVLFQKQHETAVDLSAELIQVMTTL